MEWQKCGPPHTYILAICDSTTKPHTPDFEECVCPEIPGEEKFPELHKTITTFMMHGLCGLANMSSPCIEDGKCTKNFQRSLLQKHMKLMGILIINGEMMGKM